MAKCRNINRFGDRCNANTCRNNPLCALHTSIQKMKDEGTWEDIQHKAKDKDYDPHTGGA